MDYEISLSEDGKYIRIRVAADITGKLQRSFVEEVIAEARRRSVWRFLVDVHAVRNVSTYIEQYLMAYEDMNNLSLDRSSKIAVYAGADDESHNFVETAFQNAGFQCRLYTDERIALKWLTDEESANKAFEATS